MSDDEKLIGCVRKYPVLYDSSNVKYMDTIFKNDIWKKIGEEIKIDGVLCKSRWNNIRDTYRKSLKKSTTKRGQGAKKIRMYKYSENLNFMKKYLFDERDSVSNIKSEEVQLDDTRRTSEEHNDSCLADVVIVGSDLTHPKPEQSEIHPELCPPKLSLRRRIKKTENEVTATSQLMEYIFSKNEKETPQHPVDTFLASIAATLKTFSPYNLHLARAEIFNTVQKYEFETIMGEQHTPLIHVSPASSSESTHLSPTTQCPENVHQPK